MSHVDDDKCPFCGNTSSSKSVDCLGPFLFSSPAMNALAQESLTCEALRSAYRHGANLTERDIAGNSLLHVWAWYSDERDFTFVPELIDLTHSCLHEKNSIGQTPAMIWLGNIGKPTRDDIEFLVECGWLYSCDPFADAYIRATYDPYAPSSGTDRGPLDL